MSRLRTHHMAAPRAIWRADDEHRGMCEYCNRYVRFVVGEGWIHAEE